MLFAFHEPWDSDEEKPDRSFPWLWLGIGAGGLALGLFIFLLLGPLGGAAQLMSAARVPATSPVPTSTLAVIQESAQQLATECVPTSPNATLTAFVQAINRSDFEGAWELTGVNHRQQAYGGALSQFTLTWAKWRNLSLGQTTITLPQEDQAVALAQLGYGESAGQTVELRVRMNFYPEHCAWRIENVEPLLPPD